MIHTDGRPTIANGAGDAPSKSWKRQELEAQRVRILAALERVNDEIALIAWADRYSS